MEDAAFYAHRNVIAELAEDAMVTGRIVDNPGLVSAVETLAVNTRSQGAFRLMARNALLTAGLAAQLSKVGDNHSRIELTFSDGSLLGLAELEPGEDPLDALRRLLADLAHAIATGNADAQLVRPTVVCGRLPNARTDVYKVLLDIDDVLGFPVAIVPLAALMAAIISQLSAKDLAQIIQAYSDPASAVAMLAERTGFPIGSLVRGGAAPQK
jgi:hypothetical protein